MSTTALLISAFFFIALVYSSVGFGGGSSYLALLALPLFGLPQEVIRPTALFCNVVVVTGGVIIFYLQKELKWKEALPYLVLSVPLAYLGGKIKLSERDFFLLLAVTLMIAAIFLWIQPQKQKVQSSNGLMAKQSLTGGAIGFLSGSVSIGGGIFLSPIMHIFNWSEPKRISAIASVFILVNSISGLLGQFRNGIPNLDWSFIIPLLVAVLAGGQIGSRLGSKVFNPLYIKRITAVLILVAGLIIFNEHY